MDLRIYFFGLLAMAVAVIGAAVICWLGG